MSIDDFGSILKKIRLKSGLSQDDVAKKLAISRQSISKWELGISLPDITYLVPLTRIFNCEIDDLLRLKRKDVDKLNNNFKVVIKKNINRSEYENLLLIYDRKWLDPTIEVTNEFYNKHFFAIGILDNNVVSAMCIAIHPEQNDYYLLSDLKIKDDLSTKELALKMIDSVMEMLKDMHCIKLGAFVEEENKEYFEEIGFVKKHNNYLFGTEERSVCSIDPYYEIAIKQDYYCEKLDEENAKIISKFIMNKKYKYSENIADYFKPNNLMLREYLLYLNKFDNERINAIMNGKTICGYMDMFYEDDKNLYLKIDLREECLYNEIVKAALLQAKDYCNNIKEKIKIEFIVFYVNDSLLLKEEFSFYKKSLRNIGFESNDDIMFKYSLV